MEKLNNIESTLMAAFSLDVKKSEFMNRKGSCSISQTKGKKCMGQKKNINTEDIGADLSDLCA